MAQRKQREKTQNGKVMELLTILKSGENFFTEIDQKQAQSYASRAGVKVQAVNCLLIEDYGSDEPKTSRVTKVTIV